MAVPLSPLGEIQQMRVEKKVRHIWESKSAAMIFRFI
jgi:hypothetical protein